MICTAMDTVQSTGWPLWYFLKHVLNSIPSIRCAEQRRYHIPVVFFILVKIHHLFMALNSSINFIIYCAVGKEFRSYSDRCKVFHKDPKQIILGRDWSISSARNVGEGTRWPRTATTARRTPQTSCESVSVSQCYTHLIFHFLFICISLFSINIEVKATFC